MPASPYPCDVSAAQLGEIWAAATDDEAIALLARCLQLPGDFDEEARTSIWVEMLYKWLDFGKVSEMNVTKALAVMRIMVSLHVHAVGEPPPPVFMIAHTLHSMFPLAIRSAIPPGDWYELDRGDPQRGTRTVRFKDTGGSRDAHTGTRIT